MYHFPSVYCCHPSTTCKTEGVQEDLKTTSSSSSSSSAYIVIIIKSWLSYARCVLSVGTLLKLSFPGSKRINHLPQGCVSCVYSCCTLFHAWLIVYGAKAGVALLLRAGGGCETCVKHDFRRKN